jgi:hypothetical protein
MVRSDPHGLPVPTEHYLPLAIRELQRLKKLADDAIAQLPPEGFFAELAPGDNSIAVLVKHIAGNLLSRWINFLTADGEKPDRRRDAEFELTAEDTREFLLGRWAAGWSALFNAIGPLQSADLARTITIRGEPLTVLQAIQRQLTHYAYHVGQIVYLAKHYAGANWSSLSIPRGKSEEFNRAPEKYLGR